MELCRLGIPSNPESFVHRAVLPGHPKDLVGQVGELMQKANLMNFHQPPHLLAQQHINFVKKYSALALDLKAEELKFRYAMPRHIRELMQGKRLALWDRILKDLDYPDVDLIPDMVKGFPLSGWMPKSHVFPHSVKHPTLTLAALHDSLEFSVRR